MSLGQKTKCDLSGDVAKLDLTALNQTLQTAYFKAMSELEKECRLKTIGIPEIYSDELLAMVSHKHDTMSRLMLHIGQLAELAYTVDRMRHRKIEIVNRPLDEDEDEEYEE